MNFKHVASWILIVHYFHNFQNCFHIAMSPILQIATSESERYFPNNVEKKTAEIFS
jgi:hypothetical protein